MTDEEIIINDINVSNCKFLNRDKLVYEYQYIPYCKEVTSDYRHFVINDCKYIKDCYFKQLQKEKQKNKNLTLQHIEDKSLIDTLQNACNNCNLKQENEQFGKDINVLRKTLKEIEEIAKASIYTPSCFDDPDCPKNGGAGFDNHCNEYCPILIIDKILEKVKGVENAQF